jgi:Tfp pilus assembly protein PilN
MRAVNLIPAEQRTGAPVGAGRSQGAAYAVLALLLGIAGMAVLYGKADHQISANRDQAATLASEAQQAEAQTTELAPYTSFAAMGEQRVQAVETLLESRFDWAHVFHEFGRVMPTGTSISSLDGSVGAVATTVASSSSSSASSSSSSSAKAASTPVASSTPPGTVPSFTVAGCAVNQATVAELLERLRLIDGVSEVTLVSSEMSSTGSAGGSSGGCPIHDPSYTIQLTFDALPSASAVAAAVAPAKTVSEESGAATSATAASTPTANTKVAAR